MEESLADYIAHLKSSGKWADSNVTLEEYVARGNVPEFKEPRKRSRPSHFKGRSFSDSSSDDEENDDKMPIGTCKVEVIDLCSDDDDANSLPSTPFALLQQHNQANPAKRISSDVKRAQKQQRKNFVVHRIVFDLQTQREISELQDKPFVHPSNLGYLSSAGAGIFDLEFTPHATAMPISQRIAASIGMEIL